MGADSIRLVVSCPPNHPSGQRSRAGFTFHKIPQAIDVTPEQAELIEKDPYLTVHKRHSRAWMSAHKQEFTAANVKRFEKANPPLPGSKAPETAPDASDDADKGDAANKGPAQQEGGKDASKDGTVTASPKLSVTSSKAEVIDALIRFKGMKAGEHFNPESSRDALLEVYNTAPDVEPEKQ